MGSLSVNAPCSNIFISSAVGIGIAVVSYILISRDQQRDKEAEQSLDNSCVLGVTPSEVLSLIKNRRSIFAKQYTGRAVPRDVIEEMLEAARWAPSHHLTEPYHFVVYESEQSRDDLGRFLAESYKTNATRSNKSFQQAKYDKKMKNTKMASHVIAVCVRASQTNPLLEEICSVAMAVQNMHLLATAHGLGAYWSTSGVYDPDQTIDYGLRNTDEAKSVVPNSEKLKKFLEFSTDDGIYCIGWFFVGSYYGGDGSAPKKWPQSRRKSVDEGNRVVWK